MVRLLSGLAYLALATNTVSAASLPASNDALSANMLPDHAPRAAEVVAPEHTLERRKGGGGRGGGSSGGGSSSGGGRSGGGSSSTTGGRTSTGSGPKPAYGRGAYYGGGASVPYAAGSRTPKGLIAAPLLVGGAALAIMPGLWLYSVYPYHYNNPYRFYNRTANRTNNDNDNDRRSLVYLVSRQEQGANETLPVVCLCQENSPCGCDENDDPAYISDLIGNGSYAALNKTLVTVSDVNNTRSLVLNGTLPVGTTAAGGEDSAAAHPMAKYTGYWAMGLVVLYGAML